MANCDMCGRGGNLNPAIVEGSLLNVCENCAKFGKVILIKKQTQQKQDTKKQPFKQTFDLVNVIDEDYPRKIKEAREKLGLKQEELARKINEKESVIHKLETGHLQPTLLMAKKLEKVLNISLVKTYQEENEKIDFKDAKLTIGDIAKVKYHD